MKAAHDTVSTVRHRLETTQFVSLFDLFRIGIGPSSSHTVGPMRAAAQFLHWANVQGSLHRSNHVTCELYGSLALTGRGHGTDTAVIVGLAGADPEEIHPDEISRLRRTVEATNEIVSHGTLLQFRPEVDLIFRRGKFLPVHPNALTFTLWRDAETVQTRTYYSIGGGFIQTDDGDNLNDICTPPFAFDSAEALLKICARERMTIADLSRLNECALRSDEDLDSGLDRIWRAMKACVSRGMQETGILPGGLLVKRRAAKLHQMLIRRDRLDQGDPLRAMEWVNLFALAVNEENAAGGRVVTAPTNGAAGIIPAVLHYYDRFVVGADQKGIYTSLLVSAAIGSIIKLNASISGADVGCQGEVGSAAAMAAAGLAAALGGTNEQVENAAEIALEHNLGLTCDPVGGLVQIPCIERNAMASVKAINAARLALHGDGSHRVSLDQAIETMRQTGKDMKRKYKETSLGGLAVNVPLC